MVTFRSELRGAGNILANCVTTGRYRAALAISNSVKVAVDTGRVMGNTVSVDLTVHGGERVPQVRYLNDLRFPVLWRLANITGPTSFTVRTDESVFSIAKKIDYMRGGYVSGLELAAKNGTPSIPHGLSVSIPYLSRVALRSFAAAMFLVGYCDLDLVPTAAYAAVITAFTFVQPHLIATTTVNVLRGMGRAFSRASRDYF